MNYDDTHEYNIFLRQKKNFIPYQHTPCALKITPSFFINSKKNFSDDFLNYIGFKHITYYDEEYGKILLQFFHSYLDFCVINTDRYKSEIENFINSIQNPSSPKKEWSVAVSINNFGLYNEVYLQNEPPHERKFNPAIHYIQYWLNTNLNDSYATLANILQISFQDLYSHITLGNPFIKNKKDSNIKLYSTSFSEFNLLISKDICDYNTNVLSKVCSYQIDNKYITLTASNKGDSIFAFGHTPPYATFYNFTEIDKNPNHGILFFQNINQAFAYENTLKQNSYHLPTNIITGHNSNDLEILDWSLLAHKNLIFICEPKKKAYEELTYYKYYFDKYAINFKIFPYPLLFTKLGFDGNKQADFNNLSDIEQNLLKNALYMDQNFQENYDTIYNNSLSWNDFIRWGNEIGLFSKHQAEENYFEYSPLPVTNTDTFEESIYNISLDSLFLNNSITLLHAPTETGKSILTLSIAKALLDSSQFLFFKTSQKQPNILILDGETPPEVFSKRLSQLNIDISNNKLLPISILQEKTGKRKSLWSNMDLSNDECRNQLTAFIRTHNITFIIFDNISCLVPRNLSTEKLPQEIFNWLHKLTDTCSFLLIHHTKEDGSKVKGSQLWTSRSPNEIQLINVNNYKRPPKAYKELIATYKPAEGLFCGIQFNKNKSFPILQNKIFWVTLPINASNWELLTITDKYANILEDNLPTYNFPDLDKRENLILSKTKETFTAKDAEDIIKKKRGTVLKCLKNLQNKGYIKKEGTIKSTYYIKTINNDTTSEKNQKHIEITNNSYTSPLLINKNKQIQKDKQTHAHDKNETQNSFRIIERNTKLTQPNENDTTKKSLSDE